MRMRLLLFVFGISLLLPGLESKPSDITTFGTLESQLTTMSEKLKFAFTIVNGVDLPITDVQFVNIPADYTLDEICAPACRKAADYRREKVADNVPAGSRVSAWGKLRPVRPRRREKVLVMIGWRMNAKTNTTIVNLGNNEVQSNWYYLYNTYFYGPVKTFAIPASLALIGYLLNKRAKKREEAKADADKEQGIRAEIWKQMLPTSHELASKYYLPISFAIDHAASNLAIYSVAMYGDVVKAEIGKQAAHRAFFYALLLEKRMATTRRDIGGIIFKDLRGEELAISAWFRYKNFQVGEPDSSADIVFRSASSYLRFHESFESFEAKCLAPQPSPNLMVPEMEVAWRPFDTWLGNEVAVLNCVFYLRAFGAVIDYELNRPYEYWYRPGPKLHLDEPDSPEFQIAALAQTYSVSLGTVANTLRTLGEASRTDGMEVYLAEAVTGKPPQERSRRGIFVILILLIKSSLQKLLSATGSRKASAK